MFAKSLSSSVIKFAHVKDSSWIVDLVQGHNMALKRSNNTNSQSGADALTMGHQTHNIYLTVPYMKKVLHTLP